MREEFNTILKVVGSILLSVVAYFLVQLHSELKQTSENLKETVTVIRLQQKDIDNLEKRVDRIERKLKIND